VTARIGVDFGTANTVVARWDEARGRGEPVPLDGLDVVRPAQGGVLQRVIPSLIAYCHGTAQRWLGAQVVGRPELADDPAISVFQATKSVITRRAADIPRVVGDRKITGREAATQFLADVTALAVLVVGSDDLEIVATAPVEAFDDYRDWLVREVAVGAGAARLRVVDEATAAAVGYRARMSPGDVFCVFDFGASTLDVSVVRVEDPGVRNAGVRTIAKAGLDIGGRHIDALLAEHAAAALRLPEADAVARNRIFRRLLDAAESAKIALTGASDAVITASDPVTGGRYRREITRAEFERLLRERDILGKVGRGLRKALDVAAAKGYPADMIAGVFLVGGSCLIPAVQDVIRLQFDPAIVYLDQPLEAVAAGAAAVAGGQRVHDHIQHDYVLRHVNPVTGTDEYEMLVPAGTGYPTPEPVKTVTITAIHDGQRRLGLAIYELTHATARDGAEVEIMYDANGGARAVPVSPQQQQEQSTRWLNEDRPTFLYADPPAAAGADRFRLDFRIDAQKRLTVSAFDVERRVWVLDRQPVVQLA
jgi:molecular chaperone DnaK